MIKMFTLTLVLATAIASPAYVQATAMHGSNCASCHTLGDKEASELLKRTGGTVKSIKQAPVKGFFELLMEKDGRQGIIYIDYAKRHLIQGLVIDLETLRPVSAHPLDQSQTHQPNQPTTLNSKKVPIENPVIMGNPKGTKKLYVFTDPDCPYCRKFHLELRKLEKIAPDVAIHVILYPMHPTAYDKARAVLESTGSEILDNAFDGKELPKPTRDDSRARIDANIQFANSKGITGTPTLVMPNGQILVGMRDAETLKKMLEGK